MIDLYSILKDTNVYKTILGEKKCGNLSHAYMFCCNDQKFLLDYLKIFAKLICCDKNEPCNICRACKLIDSGNYADVITYPKNGEVVLTEDISNLIEESFLKPIENRKKVFIINKAESMGAVAQNKLLKTLEEPPENVHILIGTLSEFPILSTIKSRVKKFDIPSFDSAKIVSVLKGECEDVEKLNIAVCSGDGSVGKAYSLYFDQTLSSTTDLVVDIICNMKSSADILKFSSQIIKNNYDISQIISVLELTLRDMLYYYENKESLVENKALLNKTKNATGFNTGAIIYILEKIVNAQQRLKFNANTTMLIEWLLFQILEGKYKWQK